MEKLGKFFIVMLMGFLQVFAVNQFPAKAQSTNGVYTITVTTPGTLGQVVLQHVDNLSDIVELTVLGSLNETDMTYFSRIQNLKKLDLSQTDINSISGCKGLSMLETVVLPSTMTIVSESAFRECTSLVSINLDNVTEIASYAFYKCNGLTQLNLPNVKSIGNSAFYYCSGLETVECPNVEEIGESAFAMDFGDYSTKLISVNMVKVKKIGAKAFDRCRRLTSVNIPNCTFLGSDEMDEYSGRGECFAGCSSLTYVTLSDKLQIIPYDCFAGTAITYINLPSSLKIIGPYAFRSTSLTSIDIPEGVTTIGYSAFECPLETIKLPSSLVNIGSSAFYYQKEEFDPNNWNYVYSYVLKDVYCKCAVPLATETFDNDMVKGATLHVPAFSVSAYKLDDNWYKFGKIMALEGDLSDITISNNFTIIDYTGLADKVNLTLTSSSSSAGHLTVSGNSVLSLSNFVQNQSFEYKRDYYYDENYNYIEYYHYPYCTTLIPNSEIRADNVTTKIQLPSNCWTFLSLPYDVNVSDIKVPEGTLWVVRKYNGANRAAMTGETWENVVNGQTLNAGEGYILHCLAENADSWKTVYVEFEFPAVNNANKNNIFVHNDVEMTLNQYPAEFSHHRGWNLIGNPYPAYYNSHCIDFNAPITVWNGDGYTAYSLEDDEYQLRPNEAFFVQCPVNTNQISFAKEGRIHEYIITTDYYRAPSRVTSNPDRQILNFVIADEKYNDRARLVVNEDANVDYEIERDASKFMSSNADVPQIYIIDNGVNYAIDERPLGDGKFDLGVHVGHTGTYTISLNAKNLSCNVMLTDNETGSLVNLAEESYSFESLVQTYANRFTIELENDASCLDAVVSISDLFSVNGNVLTFAGNPKVSIVSVDGKTIFCGVPANAITLLPGIYVISIDNETCKVVIK